MKVILLQDVKSSAKKEMWWRWLTATAETIFCPAAWPKKRLRDLRELEAVKRQQAEKQSKELEEARMLAAKLSGETVSIRVKSEKRVNSLGP